MIRAIMNGCHGVMGHVITDIISKDDAVEIVAGVDMNTENYAGYPVFKSLDECPEADAIIDFSTAKAVDGLLDYCETKKVPVVLCTTGLSEDQLNHVKEAGKVDAVLRSANMSIGINLLMKTLKEVAGIVSDVTSYTIRHSFAMALKEQNVPIEMISELLGHKSIKTTQIYLRSFSLEKMTVVNKSCFENVYNYMPEVG